MSDEAVLVKKLDEKLELERKNVKKSLDNVVKPGQYKLKCAKGTRDFAPDQMRIREQVFDEITRVFKLHGACTIDTPVFERKEILTQKYGEDSKLIYDLADQQGELLSLRYDLTVPFSRYLAMNKIQAMKRYQIGKVYRRDQPIASRGRYREFYQCDFDVAGNYEGSMVADAECIRIVAEILGALKFDSYEIKINHRALLDGMLEVCGVPEAKARQVSSSIDKLDKMSWEKVREELVNEKGLSAEVADKIGTYTQVNGNLETIRELQKNVELSGNKRAYKALADLELLFTYCQILDLSDSQIKFDMSLARGLDYYTGVIFEAILKEMPVLDDVTEEDGEVTSTGVGSVAAGGRYDNLVNMFDKKSKVECVGLSIGVERLFAVMQAKAKLASQKLRTNDTQVYIATPQKGLVAERLKLCRDLWNAGIKTEHAYKANPKLLNQLQYCEENQIPFCLIIGSGEIESGVVKLRNVQTREEETLKRDELIQELKKKLAS